MAPFHASPAGTGMNTKPVAKGDAIELNIDTMTVEQGLELIEVERVQPLLRYLETGVFENKTNVTFMKAYSVVVQFGDQPQDSAKLYDYYKTVIEKYCKESVASMTDLSGSELLKGLAKVWYNQTILVYWLQRVFQYLDRFYLKGSDAHNLFTTALHIFREEVYEQVVTRCVASLISEINRERDGYDIDQDSVRGLIDMLSAVGDSAPTIVKQRDANTERLLWNSSAKGMYTTDFHEPFMKATAAYFEAKVAGWLAEYSCPDFVKEATRRLEEEASRLDRYLDRSSEQDLLRVCQDELIVKTAARLVDMESGCKAMFQNRKHSELKIMFHLFKREPFTLENMTKVVVPYIEERCCKIVEDQQNIDNPQTYIEHCLELKADLDKIVAECFAAETSFQQARNRGLENVLNKDTRCAKYLALFTDLQLKKGLKGRNDDEVSAVLSSILTLFAHLKDKDIFLEFYKRSLSKRLLNKVSVSDTAENDFINLLKSECGPQAVQKLVAMFTDMALSEQLQEEYNGSSHGGSPGGVMHEVKILQTNAWPEKAEEVVITPCAEMTACTQAFEAFYNTKHSGRKLRWLYNMGQVELTAHCFKRKHLLQVSGYQCLALLLFNGRQEITFEDMLRATSMPKEECNRQVLSMTVSKHRLLRLAGDAKKIEDGTVLRLNEDFTNDKVKVVISLIKEKEKEKEKEPTESPMERKHVVDAAIVRIMKSRKKLDHQSLLAEVMKLCTLFKPQPAQIKAQIEHLIEREFLKRDAENRSVYIYLP